MSETRDIESAYRDARIQAYLKYKKTGQEDRAEQMADMLRDVHGYDVGNLDEPDAGKEKQSQAPGSEPNEHAAEEPLPEAAVEPKPARTPRKPRSAGK